MSMLHIVLTDVNEEEEKKNLTGSPVILLDWKLTHPLII